MELITMEARVFEEILSRFESFVARMENLCRLHEDNGFKKWLDNQDVCLLLSISPRSLQTLRDNGTLPFTRIQHKIYYKPEDVKKILSVVKEKRKQANYKKSDR